MVFAAPLVDTHTHTALSDGVGRVLDNARAAEERGVAIMAATDHLTLPASLDPTEEVCVSERDLPSYAAQIAEAREEVSEVEIVFGFECDWYEGCEENVRRWSEGASYRLGATHWVDSMPVDYDQDFSFYESYGPNECWKLYVETWCKACASPLNFDTMAHPDLIQRFSQEGWHATADLTPLFKQMAECAHDTGRRVEVSTAALRKGIGTFYPNHELLMMFNACEVPITIGSDAHTAADIGYAIDRAYAYAYSCGYTSFDCPRADGSWTTFEL